MYKSIIRPALLAVAILMILATILRLFNHIASQTDIGMVLVSVAFIGLVYILDVRQARKRLV
jgi:predicted neutral ceramidase superfamily lipid hydrolase